MQIKRSVGKSNFRYMSYNEEYAPKDEQVIGMLNSIGLENPGIDVFEKETVKILREN